MNDLITLHCQSSADIDELEDLAPYLNQVPHWSVNADKKAISRCYTFKNFKQTMFFINAMAYICEQEGHHPDAKFGFNYCEVLFTTHDVGGLSINDFICAAKIDGLLVVH